MVSHESIWLSGNGKRKPKGSLKGFHETGFAIVGAGITGISAAYHLALGKKKVLVLEKDFVGAGATGNSAGILVIGNGIDFHLALRQYGKRKALALWKATIKGIELIESLVREKSMGCEFERNGNIYLSWKPSHNAILRKEAEALRRFGMKADFVEGHELWKSIKSESFFGAVKTPYERNLNPLKLVQGLGALAEKNGARIFENSPVHKIRFEHGEFIINAGKGTVRAREVIIAANAWSMKLGYPDKKTRAYSDYAVCTQPLDRMQLRSLGLIGRRAAWDTRQDYCMFRLTKDNRLLAMACDVVEGGGKIVTFRKRSPAKILKNIFSIFPQLKGVQITHHWMGTTAVAKDIIPLINLGEKTKPAYSLAYDGNGLATGFFAGRAIANHFRNKLSGTEKEFLWACSAKRKMPKILDWVAPLET